MIAINRSRIYYNLMAAFGAGYICGYPGFDFPIGFGCLVGAMFVLLIGEKKKELKL